MIEYIKEYIKENLKSIVVLFSCLAIGLVVGIITYQFVDTGVKNELVRSIQNTLNITKEQGFEGINVIKNGMASNTVMVIIIYLCAITLIAPGLICIINALKGFVIGIYIPTLFQIFGFGNGLLVMFMLVVIPNIIYIPSFIYLCINSLTLHFDITEKTEKQNRFSIMIKNLYKFVIGFSVMFLSVIIEQFLSIGAIEIYKKL